MSRDSNNFLWFLKLSFFGLFSFFGLSFFTFVFFAYDDSDIGESSPFGDNMFCSRCEN